MATSQRSKRTAAVVAGTSNIPSKRTKKACPNDDEEFVAKKSNKETEARAQELTTPTGKQRLQLFADLPDDRGFDTSWGS
ncbi:uncharacterized protein JCM15063_006026 [Sporobolomyces koalae]|uniref:uncharacterized protein n=1 Tax=Sporobolomyces koalae TaxID=500713 RepID=UPI00316BE3FA